MGFIVDFIVGTQNASNARDFGEGQLELGRDIFDQGVADNAPFVQAGHRAIGSQGNALGFSGQEGFDQFTSDFQNSPFATLPFNEGQRTLETSAANRGDLLSGQTGKDLVNFGQNQANNNFGNFFNALAGVSGTGQVANANNQNAGQNLVSNSANAGNTILQGQNQRTAAFGNLGNDIFGTLGSIFGGG